MSYQNFKATQPNATIKMSFDVLHERLIVVIRKDKKRTSSYITKGCDDKYQKKHQILQLLA